MKSARKVVACPNVRRFVGISVYSDVWQETMMSIYRGIFHNGPRVGTIAVQIREGLARK